MIGGNKKIVYLASPYSHPDEDIKEFRFKWANRAAYYLMQYGFVVFSPLSHSVPIEREYIKAGGKANNWGFWKKQDFPLLRLCHEFHILMLPGWDESSGIQDELDAVAFPRRMPVKYLSFFTVESWWRGHFRD